MQRLFRPCTPSKLGYEKKIFYPTWSLLAFSV
ncbi:MAG: hypothetical protein ACI9DJ_003314, partial [Algoriphagus sp.]